MVTGERLNSAVLRQFGPNLAQGAPQACACPYNRLIHGSKLHIASLRAKAEEKVMEGGFGGGEIGQGGFLGGKFELGAQADVFGVLETD